MSIQARGLSKSYGNNHVLHHVDLDVSAGEVVALLGPNGAGKTTTLGILTTLIAAESGTATVYGFDVATQPAQVRRAISVTGQSASVDGMLTGRENIELMARLRGARLKAARDRASEALDEFGLADAGNRPVRTYSGGMRRKLDLALGLVAAAPVLILDEPTTGLDTRSRSWLWHQVRLAAKNGAAVLVTTQYLDEADQLADRVVILDQGKVVANDTPAALKASVAATRLELWEDGGVVAHSEHTAATVHDLRRLLATQPDHLSVSLRQPTLDDVFLELTSEARS